MRDFILKTTPNLSFCQFAWSTILAACQYRRCRQDVNFYVLALYVEQGRRLHLSWDFNYSYLFFNDFNFIVILAVVVALPSYSVRSLISIMQASAHFGKKMNS